jgi:hypothetical protein
VLGLGVKVRVSVESSPDESLSPREWGVRVTVRVRVRVSVENSPVESLSPGVGLRVRVKSGG